MTIQNISAQPLKPSAVNFKHNPEIKETQNHKHSAAKKIVLTTAGIAALSALTIAGIKLAKNGKLNDLKNTFKNYNKPVENYTFRGTVSANFESPKAMADEIVNNFKAMKNRLRGHNLTQWRYNKMDWSAKKA